MPCVVLISTVGTAHRGSVKTLHFELQEAVEKPRGCVSWVADISFPTTWPNISENENILYISEMLWVPLLGTTEKRFALPLEVGECNVAGLVTKLQAALNNRTGTLFDAAVGYEVFSITAGQIGIRLLWNGSNVRYDYEGVYEDLANELHSVSKNPFCQNSQAEQEFFVNVEWDFASTAWLASSGEVVLIASLGRSWRHCNMTYAQSCLLFCIMWPEFPGQGWVAVLHPKKQEHAVSVGAA